MLTESFHYRPLFGRILAAAIVVLCLVGLAGLAVAGDWANLVRTAWPLAFFGALAVALFWRPRIMIEEHGVTVVNVLRTIEVPWPAIQRIDTRFSLTLFTPGRKVPVWAAPSPGIRGAVAVERADVRNLGESAYGPGHSVRPGDSVSTPSGQVAFVLRKRWEALRDAGHLDSGAIEEGSVKVTPHWATIAALGVLFAGTVASLVV
ncbi:PH domain-containing protein [Cryobacterium tagatosivorans]|uniref:PH domain-containing protein n=1 Tax=Cryobacterium tagatosivorans TaxID=1259199 RepID=A0A4R8UGJ6_9MICO|nr:PH domain-containing protein [Cryobacterium tagatosivorans]TFB50360.1 PH domain-containing protein [Cryobacterium tagatosivorans]